MNSYFKQISALLAASVLACSFSTVANADVSEYQMLLEKARAGVPGFAVQLFDFANRESIDLGGDTGEVLELLANASNEGDMEASYRIAAMLERGVLLEQNDDGAFVYYSLAAEQGKAEAMYWCLTFLADLIRSDQGLSNVSSLPVDTELVANARKWLSRINDHSDASIRLQNAARFVFAMTLVDQNLVSEEGWLLLGELARSGHDKAAEFTRLTYGHAQQATDDERDLQKELLALLDPIIADIEVEEEN